MFKLCIDEKHLASVTCVDLVVLKGEVMGNTEKDMDKSNRVRNKKIQLK